MKKLVLTEEDIARYRALAEELRKKSLLKKQFRAKKREADQASCKCGRRYYPLASIKNGHNGYCCKRCSRGGGPKRVRIRDLERNLTPQARRKNRQLRRQEKITQKPFIRPVPSANFYESDAWRSLRYPILRKFNFMCLACGQGPRPGKPLHVDHIKPRSKYPELELDPNNLQVLCVDCNLSKSNKYEDDLRPKGII